MKRQFWIWAFVCAVLLIGCRQDKADDADNAGDADPTDQTHTPVIDAAVEKGKAYIAENQNADGGWPLLPGEDSDAETTAFAVWALAEGAKKPLSKTIQDGAAYLKGAQGGDGSWNGNAAHTVFALTALNVYNGGDSGERTKAVKWLESTQNADGSWARQAGSNGSVLYTSAVVAGLQKIGYEAKYPPVVRGAKWVLNRPAGDSGWSLRPGGASDAFATAWASLALYPVVEIPTQMEWLRCAQNVDGGFSYNKGDQSDPEITSAAVAALSMLDWPLIDQQYALNYLIYIQQKNGSFISAVPIELSEPAQNIQTSSFAVIAIRTLKASGARLP